MTGKAWFQAQETELFRHRLGSLNSAECARFLDANDLNFTMVLLLFPHVDSVLR